MEVTKTIRPGERETARLLREYGDRLVCVRYRFDRDHNKQLTTVEIIVEIEQEAPLGLRSAGELRVRCSDVQKTKVKDATITPHRR